MIPEIEQHRDEIISLCKEFGVERLFLFGSATTTNFNPAESDVDFLVLYPAGYEYGPFGSRHFELKNRLEAILNRQVDLVMGRNLRNPVFIHSLQATQQLLYAA